MTKVNVSILVYSLSFLTVLESIHAQNLFNFEYDPFVTVSNAGSALDHPWTGGLNNPQFSNIDLNGDGTLDLFIFDRSTEQVLTFLHTGNSGSIEFTYAPEYEVNFPSLKNWALLRDYNCDGFQDIFTHTAGGFKVYTNNGDNTFDLDHSGVINSDQYGNVSNLFVSSADIPSITDIDSDGDLDVITFGVWGQSVQYHRNYSFENYGVCDSLNAYVLKNDCWGRFTEAALNNNVNLYDTLSYPCDGSSVNNPQSPVNSEPDRNSRHVGSTVLSIDLDGSGVFDLILGDIDATNLTALYNSGTQPNSNSGMNSFDSSFPSNTTPLNLSIFPASFYVDVNGDQINDLVVAPNLKSFESHNVNSVHYYINTGSSQNPNFIFQTNSFLQNEMFDLGTGAQAVLFDVDQDNLKDLILSHNFSSFPDPQNPKSSLFYFKNTGSATTPEYSYVTDDFGDIESEGLGKEIAPTFGDIDGDQDDDLVFGQIDGNIYWSENTGGQGNIAVFSSGAQPLVDTDGDNIVVDNSAYPQLFDLNNDGYKDLVIGKRNGWISYYERDTLDLSFVKVTDSLGMVNVTEYWDVIGYSTPHFFRKNDTTYLFSGSKSGYFYSYDSIDNNLEGTFRLIDSTSWSINNGGRSTIYIDDLNGDGILEMIAGNIKGGVHLYTATSDSNLGLESSLQKPDEIIQIYPNPGNSILRVESSENLTQIMIYDLRGSQIKSLRPTSNYFEINTSTLINGVYSIRFLTKSGQVIQKKWVKL